MLIQNCKKCRLANTRVNVVIGRGSRDAEILVIGEAPGKSEDVLGQAFIGEAGKFLDELLYNAHINPAGCYFTNTVLCRPCDKFGGENREPSKDEIFLCLDNVLTTINCLNKLKGVIIAGKVAKRWYGSRLKGLPQVNITHPSALLRAGGKACSLYRDNLNALKEFYGQLKN
jgi:DNA polymerase